MAKARSPNYPQISLRKAVEYARKIYQSAHTHKAPASTVAATLGYTGLNGASLGVLSALKKYGLLEAVGDDVRISQEGLSILVDPPGSVVRAQAIMKAAFRPALFAELRKEYGDTPPKSDDFLRAFLLKRGFVLSIVDVPIRTYRDTMVLVEEAQAVLGVAASNIEIARALELAEEDEAMNEMSIEAPASSPVAARTAQPLAVLDGPSYGPVGSAEYMDDVYKLSEGRAFILRWPASMSEEEFDEFTAWITLLQRKLKRSIPKPSIQ